jgi:Major Facilitator Superfamily
MQIFFLHERAFRLGIYTMLLLGGKNLVPLVSAAVIQSIGWRWVFIIVGIIVAVMFVLTYLCVPETCWDRTPLTSDRLRCQETQSSCFSKRDSAEELSTSSLDEKGSESYSNATSSERFSSLVRFSSAEEQPPMATFVAPDPAEARLPKSQPPPATVGHAHWFDVNDHPTASHTDDLANTTTTSKRIPLPRSRSNHSLRRLERLEYAFQAPLQDIEPVPSNASQHSARPVHEDTTAEQEKGYYFRKKSYKEMLTIYQGRISREKWWKAALRPFILYSYPAIGFVGLQLNYTNYRLRCYIH